MSLADTALFKAEQSATAIPSILQQMLRLGVHHVRAQVVLSEANLNAAISRAVESHKRSFRFSRGVDQEEALAGELECEVGRKHRFRLSGRFLALRHPQNTLAWVVVTRDDSEFEKRVLRILLRAVRPRLTRPLIRSEQLLTIFSDLGEIHGVDHLRLRQVGSRSRIHSQGAEKPVEADRRWTDLSVTEAFQDARESGQWVVDATGAYEYGAGSEATLKVTRRGVLTFRRLVRPVFWPIVDMVVDSGIERYRFLKGRERAPTNRFHSRPFTIRFKRPVLSDREQIEHLAGVLSSLSYVTFTPMHGNPYFHAAMLDYRDGSSYDVYVLGDEHLTIVPQGRATVQALQRLCAKVFSDFREGDLEDASVG